MFDPLQFVFFIIIVACTVSLLIFACAYPEEIWALIRVDQREKFETIRKLRVRELEALSEAMESHRRVALKARYRKCGVLLSEKQLLRGLYEFERKIAVIVDHALQQIQKSWQKPISERELALQSDLEQCTNSISVAYNDYNAWLQEHEVGA
jgi:hypothetical protein